MKNIISSIICIGATVLLLTSCEDETKTKIIEIPYITLSPSSVSISADAVSNYTINYVIGNPADDAKISLSADVSWLSNIDSSISGQVRFSISKNNTGDMRTGTVTVAYTYSDGTVTASAAIIQYSAGEPTLYVDPNTILANADGGTYSFTYSIENATDEETVECNTDVSWITDFDYSKYGTVSFTVAETDEEEELRSGTISVTYNDLTKEVVVVQDHQGPVSLVGTYTAHGTVYGNGITTETEMDWIVKIYEYTGTEKVYAYYVDGMTPWSELYYETYDSFLAAAGAYVASNGTLHIPSQVTGGIVQAASGNYYLGYTPCTGKSDTGGYRYNTGFPDLVFTYDESTDQWESNYGVFMAGCESADITTFKSYFQVVLPTITLKKTSSTTSLSVGNCKEAKSLKDLDVHSNIMAE